MRASLAAQMAKNPPAMRETWVPSLGGEDPLEEGLAAHSISLPGESPGQRSLAGCRPWGRRASDTTERPSTRACCSPRSASSGCLWPSPDPLARKGCGLTVTGAESPCAFLELTLKQCMKWSCCDCWTWVNGETSRVGQSTARVT